MIKKTILTIVAALSLAAIPLSSVGAWTASLGGYGKCQSDGTFLITWQLYNHERSYKLKVNSTSDATVVPVGTTVDGNATSKFSQSVDGSKPGNFKLKLNVGWIGSNEVKDLSANVEHEHACKQPATITVNKQTSPVGDQTVFSVTISPTDPASGTVYGNATQNIVGGGSVVYKVAPGTYDVTETTMEGWTQTSNTCTNLVIVKSDEDYRSELTRTQNVNDNSSVNKECTIVNTKDIGHVLGTATTTPQVTATPKAINAGEGGATQANPSAIVGLVGSIFALALGVVRFGKRAIKG